MTEEKIDLSKSLYDQGKNKSSQKIFNFFFLKKSLLISIFSKKKYLQNRFPAERRISTGR